MDFCPERRFRMEQESKLKRFLKTLKLNESAISTVLGGLVVVVVGILVYNYFSNVNRAGKGTELISPEGVVLVEEEGQLVPAELPTTHTVAKGEHLWQIAEKYYGSGYNWVDIAKENQLVNANVVSEGQELSIPRVAVVKPQAEMETVEPSIMLSEYTVVKGDTLWKIAVRTYADGYRWPDIWQANKDIIPDANLIEIDQVLTLPR